MSATVGSSQKAWKKQEVLMSIEKLLKYNHLHGPLLWGNAYHMASVGILPLTTTHSLTGQEPWNQNTYINQLTLKYWKSSCRLSIQNKTEDTIMTL